MAQAVVTTTVVVAIAFGAASLAAVLVGGHAPFGGFSRTSETAGRRLAPKMILSADTDFQIDSSVSSTASCDNVALFLPGAQEYLCYTVQNPYTEPFTVTSMRIGETTAPATCPVSNLDLNTTAYSGTPALVVGPHGTGTMAEPISMVAGATDQDACLGTVFHFVNVGTALVTTPTTAPAATTTPATPATRASPPAPATPPAPTTPPGTSGSTGSLAFTGADIADLGLAGVLAMAVGALLVAASRRRRRKAPRSGDGESTP